MSLRHLYKDLNELGVYPDLIDENRHGNMKEVIDNVMILNMFYSYKVYKHNNGLFIMKMYSNGVSKATLTFTHTFIGSMIIIIKDKDVFLLELIGTGRNSIIRHNDNTRNITYPRVHCHDVLIGMLKVNNLDEFESMLT